MNRVRVPIARLKVARCQSTDTSLDADLPPELRYPQAGTYTPSPTAEARSTNRPIPLNVRLTSYAPFKLPQTHGHKVAEVVLASFMGPKDLDFFSDFILRAAFYLGIPAKGPVPLPRKTKRWTVIRSPFVMAKSKQNFERITYRRRISLYDANPDVVQVLLSIANRHALAGVGVKATLFTRESPAQVEDMALPSSDEMESPLALNKVDADASPSGNIAQAVLELLKDPRYGLSADALPDFVTTAGNSRTQKDSGARDPDVEALEAVKAAQKKNSEAADSADTEPKPEDEK